MDNVNNTLATPSDVPPIPSSSLLNHEFVTMSDEEARKKWEALVKAAVISPSIDRLNLLIALASGSRKAPDAFMATIKNQYVDHNQRQRIYTLFEETVIPINVPTDDYHFSLLSLRFAYSVDILTALVANIPFMTIDKLMWVYSPLMVKLYLDSEMEAWAKELFNYCWRATPMGPWSSQSFSSFVYAKHSASKYLLPTFTASGNRIPRPGPYSRGDLEEWMNSVRRHREIALASIRSDLNDTSLHPLLDLANIGSNGNDASTQPLLALWGNFSLNTDGDEGDNGGSMDTS